MGRQRAGSLSSTRLRNLKQYKDLPEEEFEVMVDRKKLSIDINNEFERRIQRKIDSFGEDYDLSDLKANDILTLRALAQSYIQLEDLETYLYTLRSEGRFPCGLRLRIPSPFTLPVNLASETKPYPRFRSPAAKNFGQGCVAQA